MDIFTGTKRMLGCFVAVFFFLIVSQPEAAAPQLKPIGKLGDAESVTSGLAIDNAGNLYLAEIGQQTITKYDTYGRKISRFTSVPLARGALAVTPMGNRIYASAEKKVLALNGYTGAIEGRLTPSSGEFGKITAIEIDDRGLVYITDSRTGTVSIFNADGELRKTIGGEEGIIRFGKLSTLAINHASGELWVVDSRPLNSAAGVRLLIFDLAANFLREMSVEKAFGNLSIGCFCAITFDPMGQIYVLDGGKKQIISMDIDTGETRVFADTGFAHRHPAGTPDLTYDSVTNRLFVSCGAEVFILEVDKLHRSEPLAWN